MFCKYFAQKFPFVDLNDSGLNNQYPITRWIVQVVMLHSAAFFLSGHAGPQPSSLLSCLSSFSSLQWITDDLDYFASLCFHIHSLFLEYFFPFIYSLGYFSSHSSSQSSPFCEVFSDRHPNRVDACLYHDKLYL